jgi:hypothetical protein
MHFGIVTEGRTDTPLIEAVIRAVFGDDARATALQPRHDALAQRWTDGGWTRVREWCAATARDGGWGQWLMQHDALIVQLDADVLWKAPVEFDGVGDLAALCETVKGWVSPKPPPASVVIALPKESTGTWLLAALSPGHRADPESLPDPEAALTELGVPKQRHAYLERAVAIIEELPALRDALPELDHFVRKLEALKVTLDSRG